MKVSRLNDIKDICVKVPQSNGTTEDIHLQELDSIESVLELAEVARRVVMHDTADLIFRLFAKAQNGDADLDKLSERIPCLNKKYLPGLKQFFNRSENAEIIQVYNSSTDKKQKRELRNQINSRLIDYVARNIETKDLQYNFSKFKYKFDIDARSLTEGMAKQKKISQAAAKVYKLNVDDPFIMSVFHIWMDYIEKRTKEKREAYWLLIKDSAGKIIGMTFISSRVLNDKLVGKNIIGHSGQILDPSVQGKGYISVIKSVMIDFMYDHMDPGVAQDALFATTCDEFNENSQGLQIKSGATLLKDEEGNAIITSGKMHWYATKDAIMNSELMKKTAERGVKYTVSYADGRPRYTKNVGGSKPVEIIDMNIKGLNNDRL